VPIVATLRIARSAASRRERRRGPFARMWDIAREGDSAATPLVLLGLMAVGLGALIAVTLTIAMTIYELV
jgi:hypothetical protein